MADHRKPVPEIALLISCLSGLLFCSANAAQAGSFAALYSPGTVAAGEAAAGEADADAPAEKPKKKQYAEDAVKHYNRGVEFHQNGSLNQPPEQTPSIGCNIKWKSGQEPDYFTGIAAVES